MGCGGCSPHPAASGEPCVAGLQPPPAAAFWGGVAGCRAAPGPQTAWHGGHQWKGGQLSASSKGQRQRWLCWVYSQSESTGRLGTPTSQIQIRTVIKIQWWGCHIDFEIVKLLSTKSRWQNHSLLWPRDHFLRIQSPPQVASFKRGTPCISFS